MKGYLGETFVTSLVGTPFEGYDHIDWSQYFIDKYGGIDGEQHKAWTLDQMTRCLMGTPVIVVVANWSDGSIEYRCSTGEPSEEYARNVAERAAAGDPVNMGVAP